MVFTKKWVRNHPKFLLHFLIHIDVNMLCTCTCMYMYMYVEVSAKLFCKTTNKVNF